MRHARSDYDRIQDPAGIIAEDEPVFLIRGTDVVGPEAIKAWAYLAASQGASDDIVNTAILQAEKMKEWQKVNGCKIPGAPAETLLINQKEI